MKETILVLIFAFAIFGKAVAVPACSCTIQTEVDHTVARIRNNPQGTNSTGPPKHAKDLPCPENDIDYEVNDIKMVADLSDWQSCSRECSKEKRCSHWTWVTPDYQGKFGPAIHNWCFLKNSGKGRKVLRGVVSGLSSCDG